MTARPTRLLGWTAAALGAAALLSGAAVALTVTRRTEPEPLVLTVAMIPPAGLTVAAVANPAPAVQGEAPEMAEPAPPTEDAPPDLPQTDAAPTRPDVAPITRPDVETPALADLSLPAPAPEPKPKPNVKPKPRPQKPEPAPEDQPKPKAEKRTASAGASAPVAGIKAQGGSTVSPAAYAKAVMKKVRATRRQSGAGKGTVVVGFSIAADGGLAGVQVLQGSGNAALDRVALDHIRRSAPFPAPPEGAGRSYSFEFVGK